MIVEIFCQKRFELPVATHSFTVMEKHSLLKEIMEEVENLNRSIEELCPEIISKSIYPSIADQDDEMSRLIEHRIKLLTKESMVSKDLDED